MSRRLRVFGRVLGSVLGTAAGGRSRRVGGLVLTASMLLYLGAVAWAQEGGAQQQTAPPPPSQPQTAQPTTTPQTTQAQTTPAAPSSAQPSPASGGGAPPRKVAVDAAGGPTDLSKLVASAIDTWARAAPQLVDLRIDPAASSSIAYPPPALLGPDTLSLDLRTPGASGITVQVAPAALKDHPMVLLHEVGVLLGLPEGKGDVMAFAVPASGEPDAPSAADVQALRAQRTYAPEDLNHDGTVDFYDLVLFGQAFGTQGVNLPADFNHDGRVDLADLQMLRAAYTFSPPSPTTPPGQGSASSGGATSSTSGGAQPSSGTAGTTGSSGSTGSSAGDSSSPSSGGNGSP